MTDEDRKELFPEEVSVNPLLKRLARGDHGERAEKRTAKRLGGRTTPASGSQQHSKGDINLPDFLVENKATSGGSFSVKLDWLQKISHEATGVNKVAALAFQFVDGRGVPVRDGKWVAVPEYVFQELTGREILRG